MKDTFLFLYIQAGGGHISTAKALSKYLQLHYPTTINPMLVDAFEEGNWLLKKIIVDGYKKSQSTGQWVFEFLYWLNKWWLIAKINQVILSWFLQGFLKKKISKEQPKQIVVLHFFLVRPIVHVLRKLHLDIPVTTIITDPFTIHRLRSLDKKMDYVVFSEQAKQVIVKRGVPEEQVHTYPVILREEFSRPLSDEEIIERKYKYGVSLDKKVLLLLGSGDGLPNGDKILKEIVLGGVDVHVLAVCGKNASYFNKLQTIKKTYPDFPLTIFEGFIDFVYDLINISDVIVTKGGPATLMEILMMNKVPLITSYIWEQEKGNVEFVVHNSLGIYEPTIRKMIPIIKRVVEGEEGIEYRRNIEKLHLKNGTEGVAEYLLGK